jgi:hypothetical protein
MVGGVVFLNVKSYRPESTAELLVERFFGSCGKFFWLRGKLFRFREELSRFREEFLSRPRNFSGAGETFPVS